MIRRGEISSRTAKSKSAQSSQTGSGTHSLAWTCCSRTVVILLNASRSTLVPTILESFHPAKLLSCQYNANAKFLPIAVNPTTSSSESGFLDCEKNSSSPSVRRQREYSSMRRMRAGHSPRRVGSERQLRTELVRSRSELPSCFPSVDERMYPRQSSRSNPPPRSPAAEDEAKMMVLSISSRRCGKLERRETRKAARAGRVEAENRVERVRMAVR